MRRQERRGGALLAAMLLLIPSLGAKPLPAARLAFVRGPGAERCPDEGVLRGAVAARLGYDPFRDDAPRSITARVEQAGGALRGEVTLRGSGGAIEGKRRLAVVNDDCDELVASMALAISIAVDPEVLFRPAPTAPADRAPASPPATGGPPPKGAPPPASARGSALPPPALVADPLPATLAASPPPPRVRFHAEVGGLAATGVAPGVSGGVTAQLGLRYRTISAAIEGRADVPRATGAPGGGSVSAGLLAASLVPCFHASAFAACGLGTIGALRGAGAGVSDPRTAVTPFAALGVRAAVEIPVAGIVSVDLHGDFSGILTHTTLTLAGQDVWATPRSTAALGAGVRVHFP